MMTSNSPGMPPVYRSRKWFASTGRNGARAVQSPNLGRVHSQREKCDSHRHPGIRWHFREKDRDLGVDRTSPSGRVSVHQRSSFSIFRAEPLDRYREGSTLAGVIYILRIFDDRFGGITGRNFDLLCKLCGESALKNIIIVTNMWTGGSQDINEAREEELSSQIFKPALKMGAQMVRHHSSVQSAHKIVRRFFENRPLVLQIQRELVDERKDFMDTAVGKDIEFGGQIDRHRAELEKLREEMMQALKAQDGEAKRELREGFSSPVSMASRPLACVQVLFHLAIRGF